LQLGINETNCQEKWWIRLAKDVTPHQWMSYSNNSKMAINLINLIEKGLRLAKKLKKSKEFLLTLQLSGLGQMPFKIDCNILES